MPTNLVVFLDGGVLAVYLVTLGYFTMSENIRERSKREPVGWEKYGTRDRVGYFLLVLGFVLVPLAVVAFIACSVVFSK